MIVVSWIFCCNLLIMLTFLLMLNTILSTLQYLSVKLHSLLYMGYMGCILLNNCETVYFFTWIKSIKLVKQRITIWVGFIIYDNPSWLSRKCWLNSTDKPKMKSKSSSHVIIWILAILIFPDRFSIYNIETENSDMKTESSIYIIKELTATRIDDTRCVQPTTSIRANGSNKNWISTFG